MHSGFALVFTGVADCHFLYTLVIGLYMILLHTIVNGWGGRKKYYKNIISTSMMKFQGRQTVRNMFVLTVLIAGAYFALFYTPMTTVGSLLTYETMPIDYSFHSQIEQNVPNEAQIREMAKKEKVEIIWMQQAEKVALVIDGEASVEKEGKMGVTYTKVYCPMVEEAYFLSESSYRALTGDQLDVSSGGIVPILSSNGSSEGRMYDTLSLVTNPVTLSTLEVTVQEMAENDTLFGHYVLDDKDFAYISQGLTPEWRENQICFNVNQDSYPFAKTLFNGIVDGSDASCEIEKYYDRIQKRGEEERGETYWGDTYNDSENFSYEYRDSSEFRMYWKYMPTFRILDKNDMIRTMAVFKMLFVFVSIICFAAVIVIGYTRCITIGIINAKIYDDLRHFGASRSYLYQSVKGQIKRVWGIPALVGTVTIFLFYMMILYFNDGGSFFYQELASLGVCLLLVGLFSGMLYVSYRTTLKKVCRILGI